MDPSIRESPRSPPRSGPDQGWRLLSLDRSAIRAMARADRRRNQTLQGLRWRPAAACSRRGPVVLYELCGATSVMRGLCQKGAHRRRTIVAAPTESSIREVTQHSAARRPETICLRIYLAEELIRHRHHDLCHGLSIPRYTTGKAFVSLVPAPLAFALLDDAPKALEQPEHQRSPGVLRGYCEIGSSRSMAVVTMRFCSAACAAG